MTNITKGLLCSTLLLLSGCASYGPQYANPDEPTPTVSSVAKTHSIYLMGDAGKATDGPEGNSLEAFKNMLESEGQKQDVVIYLGDNIYPSGLPKEDDPTRKIAEGHLDAQVAAVKNFKGKTYFIPGNHDWYAQGPAGVKRQEKYIEDALNDKNAFQPENGCPIENIDLSDEVVLITLDTQWYLADWDKFPTLNDKCEIKSRKDFFLELEDKIKDNNEKTVIVAMHHPAWTYGPHGGYFGYKRHIYPTGGKFPLPILGSFLAQVRTQGGVSAQDRYNQQYNDLMKRLTTIAAGSDRVVLVSGHEHTLQYIDWQDVKQIVSGSGSKTNAAALGAGAKFVTGENGFAVLDVYEDKSTFVRFYAMQDGQAVLRYTTQVHEANKKFDVSGLPDSFESTKKASAYKKELTIKSDRYNWFWGEHYRDIYGVSINVPVITLDSYKGGLVIERKGGGHQTRSLRLVDKQDRNFALRAVRKSAVQFLQAVAFKDTYIEEDFKQTLTESVILDFYTSSHPYASFVVGDLADAIGVFHTNPQLVYMPKHKQLGHYNTEFGDELYIIEERPDNGFLDVASFGKPDAIESTSDVIKNLRKDEKYSIDEKALITARLFDMLLGDWDRHQDQWRWARFDVSKDEIVYKPIPRDRDQVFSNYDGALFDVLKTLVPSAKQFQEFDDQIRDIKWLNLAGMKMDRAFLQESTKDVWLAQAQFIEDNLTDQVIDQAFLNLPEEVRDDRANKIASDLKKRRSQLLKVAGKYYDYLSKMAVMTATDKDDQITVVRTKNQTTVSIHRIKDGKVMPPFKQRTFDAKKTKEIWIYALDDKDQIIVNGFGNNPILTRVIGGQDNDSYTIENGRQIKIYDYKTTENTIIKAGKANIKFDNIYSHNVYDFDKQLVNVNSLVPSIGFNPDDGMKIGVSNTYIKKGFKDDPFQAKHTISAGYFFATDGFDLQYQGIFAQTFGEWDFMIGGRYTSENFSQNFFGFGNDSKNPDDVLGLDYNRVKLGIRNVHIGVNKKGNYGSSFKALLKAERIEVQETPGRFIEQVYSLFDEAKTFVNTTLQYTYESADNFSTPRRGMFFSLKGGVTSDIKDFHRIFAFIHPSLEFYNTLSRNKKLVLRTKAQGQFNIGHSFEFYQAATLGAATGLRGYRLQRFNGESALAFSGDLRYHLLKFKTGLLPLQLGVYGGYDYGRVWFNNDAFNGWYDSAGGGFWISAVESVSGEFGLFTSDEGLRFSFGFGLQF